MQSSGLTESWWVDEDGLILENADWSWDDQTEHVAAPKRVTPRLFVASMVVSAALSAFAVALLVRPSPPAPVATVVAAPPAAPLRATLPAPRPAPPPAPVVQELGPAPAPAPAPARTARPAVHKPAHAKHRLVAKHKPRSWANGFAD